MSQTVARAMEILRFISDKKRTLGEIAEHSGVHKSTALRLLQTLVEGDFVRRLEDGRYGIGFGLVALGNKALDQIDIRAIAHPYLQALGDRCGHTIHLGQLIGDRVVYVDKIEGRGSVAMGSKIGLSAEVHTAAVAKVIATYLDDADRDRLLKTATYRRYTPTTIVTPGALTRDLEVSRQRGWAEDDGEREDYINCVALPIFDASGRVNLGLSVTALKAVARLEELRELLPTLRETAGDISGKLGWHGNEYGEPNTRYA